MASAAHFLVSAKTNYNMLPSINGEREKMSDLLLFLGLSSIVASHVFFIIFIVRWIMKRSKWKFGVVFAVLCFLTLPLTYIGSSLDYWMMTPEERTAYDESVALEASRDAEERAEREASKAAEESRKEESRLAEESRKEESRLAEESRKEESRLAEESREAAEESARNEYLTCTVDELVDELENNALNAKDSYEGRNVEITGRVEVIDASGKYICLYPVDNEWSFISVQCFVVNKEQINYIKKISNGDIITLRGKITSVGEILGYALNIHEFIEE